MKDLISAPRPQPMRAVLISVALGGMLVPLNSSMIAVALPEIMKDFGASVSAAGWLVTVYLITMATVSKYLACHHHPLAKWNKPIANLGTGTGNHMREQPLVQAANT